MSEKIRILLADDHPLLVAGMKEIMKNWEEIEVIGTAGNGKEAILFCENQLPDIILMDLHMPEMSGAEATGIIKKKWPGVRVVALTAFPNVETVVAALDQGCDGFLLKTITPEVLRSSIVSIQNGISVIDAEALERLRTKENVQPEVFFSSREKAILKYICQGFTNKEIAGKLHLQPGTVKNMVSLLLSKTYCVSRAELVRYAMEHHLVEDNQ